MNVAYHVQVFFSVYENNIFNQESYWNWKGDRNQVE